MAMTFRSCHSRRNDANCEGARDTLRHHGVQASTENWPAAVRKIGIKLLAANAIVAAGLSTSRLCRDTPWLEGVPSVKNIRVDGPTDLLRQLLKAVAASPNSYANAAKQTCQGTTDCIRAYGRTDARPSFARASAACVRVGVTA